ncbi:chlorite dismutase [Bosea sp. AAP35]|uniref:chlorite dismutase family protein n=1 Tax=Bosea sp. AAP35 TaxID=1523417 RepID=UPI0006B8E345|nr:chlorite dismutase family protein [Bosea sp. AAP35]KPF69791.1 chlorite dismutase [Bosea sp. AAP35]
MASTYVFSGGTGGQWLISSIAACRGAGLAPAPALTIRPWEPGTADGAVHWRLLGTISNTRYATRDEMAGLRVRQEGLDRPQATHAALIPIRKSAAWWALAQDERRAIFEETSQHTAIGMEYLPAIARRLHHSRDLGEPFDFLTWFEFAPADEPAFDKLLARLRATREWDFVEREVDIRLVRAAPG